MRILIVIPAMGLGGAQRATTQLANHWAGRGAVRIVTLAPLADDFYALDSQVERASVALLGQSRNRFEGLVNNLLRINALRREIDRFQPDIVLGMMTSASVLVALACIGFRARSIGAERTYPGRRSEGRLWTAVRWLTYGWLHAVVAQTPETAQWIEAHTTARGVKVIANAAPWPLAVQEPRVNPSAVLGANRSMILSVGRLDPGKAFNDLIDAFARLAAHRLDWDLVILGEGPARAALERHVQVSGLQGRVLLPGAVGNARDWYERASIFALSSLFEGFPNVLVEAMAMGVAVVSTDCDVGPRNIVNHGADGRLVPVSDVPAMAAALDELIGDPAERARLASAAEGIRERLSVKRIMSQWDELFMALAPHKG